MSERREDAEYDPRRCVAAAVNVRRGPSGRERASWGSGWSVWCAVDLGRIDEVVEDLIISVERVVAAQVERARMHHVDGDGAGALDVVAHVVTCFVLKLLGFVCPAPRAAEQETEVHLRFWQRQVHFVQHRLHIHTHTHTHTQCARGQHGACFIIF